MQRVRVLIFTNSFRVGGSERQAVELVKGLDRTRFEPFVACLATDGPLAKEIPSDVEPPRVFPLTAFYDLNAVRQTWRFSRFLCEVRPHLMQCFDFYTNVFAIPVARLMGVPVILGARREEAVTKTWAQRRLERCCYRMATGVATNANGIREQVARLDGVGRERIWTIHNGLDLRRFEACRPGDRAVADPVTVAVIANLRPEKGHLVFLEAVRLLRTRVGGVRVLIVGDGLMRGRIEEKIDALSLHDLVHMAGAQSDIPNILQYVDIVVLPSVSNEGFPNAVMEAMAAGLPVVATDTGGTRELVVDGVTGYVVPPRDAAALEERIAWLCEDSALRTKMGAAGRARVVEEFTVAKMVGKFEALYERLTEKTMGSAELVSAT